MTERSQGNLGVLRHVPEALIAVRILLGPVLIGASVLGWSPVVVISVLVVAMLTDIFDGVIARRLGIAVAPLRVWDSRADAWFFGCVGLAAWLTARDVIKAYALPIVIELALQAAAYAYDLARYRRITSLHAYSAKIWGVTLFLASASVLAFHYGPLIWVSFAFGLISAADATAIKLILPGWRHDVLSAFHAMRMRKAELRPPGEAGLQADVESAVSP